MKTGGIFTGPTALGTYGALGAEGVDCTLGNAAFVKRVQAWLKLKGAPCLHVDGDWQGCTAAAYQRVVGPVVMADKLKEILGQPCMPDNVDPFLGTVPGLNIPAVAACPDKSDGVPANNVCGEPGRDNPPVEQQCPSGQVWNPIVQHCIIDPLGIGGGGKPGGDGTGTGTQTTNIPGVIDPTDCPSGSFKDPVTGSCLGAGGMQKPSVCPAGYTMLPGTNKCAKTDPNAPDPGACPEGQYMVPYLGCAGTPTNKKDQCAKGQSYLPVVGCWGTPVDGGGQPAQGCPTGQTSVPFIGCFGTSKPGGECGADQINVPVFGCVPNPLSTVSTKPGGGGIIDTITGFIGGLLGGKTPLPGGLPGTTTPGTGTPGKTADKYGLAIAIAALVLGSAAVWYGVNRYRMSPSYARKALAQGKVPNRPTANQYAPQYLKWRKGSDEHIQRAIERGIVTSAADNDWVRTIRAWFQQAGWADDHDVMSEYAQLRANRRRGRGRRRGYRRGYRRSRW